MFELNTPIQYLKGVGPKMAQRLKILGLETVQDLLFYYPRKWIDFSQTVPVSQLRIEEIVIIKGRIVQIKTRRSPRKGILITEGIIEDEKDHQLPVVWFNQPYLAKSLKQQGTLLFRGKIDFDFAKKQKVMLSPIVERQEGIFPIYPETEGLTSKYLRRILLPLLNITSQINDFLPNTIKESEKLIDLPTAIGEIHFPRIFKIYKKPKSAFLLMNYF